MEIKGAIGEPIHIKGVIEEININAEGTNYIVKIEGFEPKSFKEELLVFANHAVISSPTAVNVQPEVRRGPGRPKKTTVDDLVNKCLKDN